MTRRAVFLDRDGVLNVRPPEHEYVTSPQDFVWLSGAADGAARLARAGYLLAIVSNQRGVARGLVSSETLQAIEQLIQDELAVRGASVTSFRYCLHDESAGCSCRKPRPGMILDLAAEFDIDLRNSWLVGDSESDVRAGRAAGCKTVFVGDAPVGVGADLMASSLLDASHLILARSGAGDELVRT